MFPRITSEIISYFKLRLIDLTKFQGLRDLVSSRVSIEKGKSFLEKFRKMRKFCGEQTRKCCEKIRKRNYPLWYNKTTNVELLEQRISHVFCAIDCCSYGFRGFQLPYRLRRERTSLVWLPALEPGERCVKYASSILGRHRGSNE